MKAVFLTLAAVSAETWRQTPPGYLSGVIELDNEWGQFDLIGLDASVQDFIDPYPVSTTGEPWVRIKITHTSIDGNGYLYTGATSSQSTTSYSSDWIWEFDVDGDDFYWCGPVSTAPGSFSIWGECDTLCLSADFKISYTFYYFTGSSMTTTNTSGSMAECENYWTDMPLGHVREHDKESMGVFASEFYAGASASYLYANHFGISTYLNRAESVSEQGYDLYFEVNTDVGLSTTQILMCYSSWNPILFQGAAVNEADLPANAVNSSGAGLCDLGCYPNDDCSFASLSAGDLENREGSTIGNGLDSFYATTVIAAASQTIDGDHQVAFAFGHFPAPAATVQFSLFAVLVAFLMA
jgi:hypothetical protein